MLSILEISKSLQSIKNRTKYLVFKKKKKLPKDNLKSIKRLTKNKVFGVVSRFDPEKRSTPKN